MDPVRLRQRLRERLTLALTARDSIAVAAFRSASARSITPKLWKPLHHPVGLRISVLGLEPQKLLDV